MKILITGATGLIGQELTTHLLENGHQVNFLTTRKSALINEPNHKGFLWDVNAMTIDGNCLNGVETIIHLAGETVFQRWSPSAKKKIMDSRVKSTQLLIDAIHEHPDHVKHVITASAIGLYPNDKHGKALQEDEVPPFANNFLAQVCIAWESMGMHFKELGVEHAIVRIGIVLSDKGGALEQMVKPVKMYAGAGFGDGNMWQSWIAIDDLIAMFNHIAVNKLTGIFNGVAPNPVRNRIMIEAIGKTVNKPVFLPNVPEFVMKLMLGEMAAIVLSSQHVSSARIEENRFTFKYPLLEDALQAYLSK